MSQTFLRKGLLLIAVAVVLISCISCQSVLFTAAYLIKGQNVDPKYNFLLKGKKRVVVVCRSLMMNQFQSETVPRDLTRKVSQNLAEKLKKKNKKLEVVDYRKVEKWLDDSSHVFEEFTEIGAAFKADIVIGIELQSFQIQENPSTMQGKARWTVKTYDMNRDELIAEDMMRLVDPPEVPISISDRSSLPQFQLRFVDLISRQIAALYHPYNPSDITRIDADSIGLH
ncbi:MAG: hypothetical protein FWC43_07660 [Planctomycetaceae bacterium]|nr:hypothetical protein [Planctomycetaceae bacterium]